jgi:LPXTG-site transpeptidase (sortase) family protein
VIAGHLDSPTAPAVFWDLKKLELGDEIIVTDHEGKQWTFRVTEKQVYGAEDAPLQEIFGSHRKARLNLITCGGEWDTNTRTYSERLAVFAELVDES